MRDAFAARGVGPPDAARQRRNCYRSINDTSTYDFSRAGAGPGGGTDVGGIRPRRRRRYGRWRWRRYGRRRRCWRRRCWRWYGWWWCWRWRRRDGRHARNGWHARNGRWQGGRPCGGSSCGGRSGRSSGCSSRASARTSRWCRDREVPVRRASVHTGSPTASRPADEGWHPCLCKLEQRHGWCLVGAP